MPSLIIDWICDGCGCLLNDQEDFDDSDGTWTCTECGFVNDVTLNNITEELRAELHLDEDDEEDNEDPTEDEDFELADLCHGGDLTEG